MSKLQKLIEKVLQGRNVSYEEAENLLRKLGFELEEARIIFFERRDIIETFP